MKNNYQGLDELKLKTYRFLMALSLVLLPSYHIAYIRVGIIHPIISIIGVMSAVLTLFFLSYKSKNVIKNIQTYSLFLVYLFTIHSFETVYLNDFNKDLIFTHYIIVTISGIVVYSLFTLSWYIAFNIATFAALYAFAGFDFNSIMLGLFATVCFVTYMTSFYRIQMREIYRAVNAELTRMAMYDKLTGFPNRNLLEERMEHAVKTHSRNENRFCLIFIDIDNLKFVNDKYGHNCGDKLLKECANRINGAIRSADTLSRIGGDEFVVLCPNISEGRTNITNIAKRIISSFDKMIDVDNNEIKSGASLGISIYPDNSTDVSFLLREADIAMYKAKKSGKGKYIFSNVRQDT
jgi:diguanylate cyclase (GGDEF)-like protein